MMKSLSYLALLMMFWTMGGHAQDREYSDEEMKLIKGMLWTQGEIDKEQAAEVEKAKKQEVKKEPTAVTAGDTNLKKEGNGWVLEFDDQAPAAQTAETQDTGSTPAAGASRSSGIEFIVGGQGKDGLAKKRDLPILD